MQDIAEIRSMMERSSKFLSLAGWAGILAGIYALVAVYIAYEYLALTPEALLSDPESSFSGLSELLILGIILLALAVGTAIFLSSRKASEKGEKLWNPTSRRLLEQMAVPLITGGILILMTISLGYIGLLLPFSLLFYGLALFNAGKYTYSEVKFLGLIEIVLGLLSFRFPQWGLYFWATGFGAVHIIYGIYMHYRYEK